MREQPESIAFLGGGVISAELGQTLARFGSKVSIIDRNSRILSVVDPEVANYLTNIFSQMGIELITDAEAKVCSINSHGEVCLEVESDNKPDTLTADQLFVAIGRVPNIIGLALENAGIDYTRHRVTVDEELRTSVQHI